MAKRTSKQIQESLLEQYKVWRRGSDQSQPPLEGPPSGGLGGGGDIYGLGGRGGSPMQIDIGLGGTGRGTASSKPRVSIQKAKELGIVKPDPKVWRRGESSASDARKRAEAFLSGQGFKTKSEPPSVDKPQVTPGSQTAQERLVRQAQLAQRGQDTAEPATVRDLIAAVPGLTKTNMVGAALGGGLIGAGLGLKGAEMLSDPVAAEQERVKQLRAEQERAEWLKKFDAGLEKSGQEQQQIGQSVEQSQKVLDRLGPQQRRAKKDQKNEAAEKPAYTREQYLGWAKKYAEQFDVPLPMVLHAMYKETGWLGSAERMRTATSPTGARGVMQIQPEYAEKGAYKIKVKDLTDPEKNIEAGVRGLAYYLSKHQMPEKALAAYNAGEGGARRFLKTGDVKYLKRETQKYIKDYKDDVIHQLEKFYPKNKDKVAQVATDILGIVTGSQTAQAADQVPPVATTSADKKSPSAEKTNVGTKTQTSKPAGSTYTTTDTQGKTTTYIKNAKGQWVSKSGEILPMPVSPAQSATQSVEKTQPSKDSEPSWIEKLYGIDQAKDVQSQWAADVTKQEKERKERLKTPKTQQSVSGIIEPNAAVAKNKEYQPLLTIEKEKREREQARKSNKPMQAPSFDPELDPKGWAEYEEYMQQRQIDAGDRFSREREARLAREKKAAEKSTQQDVSSLLQKDQAGIKSAYKGSAGAQAIMQQNPDVIKDVNRIRAGDTIKVDGQDYTIKPGDTLDRIAQKMKPSVQAVSPEPVSVQGSAQGYDDFRKLIDVAAGMPRPATADAEPKAPASSEIKKAMRNFERQQVIDNLVKQVDSMTSVPAPKTAEELAQDELWKDIRAHAAGRSSEEISAAAKQAMQELEARIAADQPASTTTKSASKPMDIEFKGSTEPYTPPIDVPIDSKEQARRQAQKDAAIDELKESINIQSRAELHDILRLAGRTK